MRNWERTEERGRSVVRVNEDEDVLRYVDLAIVLTGIKSGTLLGATVIRCRRN